MKMLGMAISAFLCSTSLLAAESHEPTPQEIRDANRHNRQLRGLTTIDETNSHPVLDVADFGYVLMSARDDGNSEIAQLRETIARNLPEGVKLVILSTKSEAAQTKRKYSEWIAEDRLIVASDNSSLNRNGFWARDSFPIPVQDPNDRTSLVAMNYYRPFESADTIAAAVAGKVRKVSQIFVGGNLLSDEEGNCFSVNSYRMFELTPDEIKAIFGCKSSKLLKHLTGLGDVDEVIKPLKNRRILTNNQVYQKELESLGYEVIMLPSLRQKYRTYVNSLVVGQTVFMPAYGVAEDKIAAGVYEDLGYKVITINSNDMSDSLHGSVHCQTMAYPKMSELDLMNLLNVTQL